MFLLDLSAFVFVFEFLLDLCLCSCLILGLFSKKKKEEKMSNKEIVFQSLDQIELFFKDFRSHMIF